MLDLLLSILEVDPGKRLTVRGVEQLDWYRQYVPSASCLLSADERGQTESFDWSRWTVLGWCELVLEIGRESATARSLGYSCCSL